VPYFDEIISSPLKEKSPSLAILTDLSFLSMTKPFSVTMTFVFFTVLTFTSGPEEWRKIQMGKADAWHSPFAEALKSAEAFYQAAEKRDLAFVENIQKIMKKTSPNTELLL